ncbi:MAG: hypothetical protein ACOC5B_01575 [Myxococcota bacterium]
MRAHLDMVFEDGRREHRRIAGSQVTLGRAEHADITVSGATALAPEHVLLAPRSDGCWVSVVQGADPPLRVQGAPFTQGMVPWGTEVRIGSLRVTPRKGAPSPATSAGKPAFGPPVIIAALVTLPIAAWMLLRSPNADEAHAGTADAPGLFDGQASCPAEGTDEAQDRAHELWEAAAAKAQRYHYEPSDGVQAVGLYERAVRCLRQAGQPDEAEVVGREAAPLRRRIEIDYRTYRLRLDRALEEERVEDALLATRILGALLGHRADDPYVTWLDQLERRLVVRLQTSEAEG